MPFDAYGDALTRSGFRPIGHLSYRLKLDVWWQADYKIQVTLLTAGSDVLIKGSKTYYLRSISEEGQTWVRDLGPLQDWLESHFPELHLSFSHFRDVTATLAAAHLEQKRRAEAPTLQMPTTSQIAQLQRELNARKDQLRSNGDLISLDSGGSDLLGSHLHQQGRNLKRDIKVLEKHLEKGREGLGVLQHLQREYEHKGAAACLVFSLGSSLQVASDLPGFEDALASIVKELRDAHRYQVSQKLNGGRLNIQIAESDEPAMTWLEQWFGGALSPRQLKQLGPAFGQLSNVTKQHTMVTVKEDIRMDGHVRESRKLISARVVSNLCQRLDRTDQTGRRLQQIPRAQFPIELGRVVVNGRVGHGPLRLPLAESGHIYISGKTGSGKSYTGRVIVEEAAQYETLNILVLDPRNQAVGLMVPEDRDQILNLYPDFGMKASSAKGFCFDYYVPGQPGGKTIPGDLSKLASGKKIVSFKGLDDQSRCRLYRKILEAVFACWSREESAHLRQLVVIEEAHLFTHKRVDQTAKAAGKQAENALDTVVREGRKYGIAVCILSQANRDFSYDSANIRQNTTTKVFLHNSDREVDYAGDFIGDGRAIIRLPRARAIIHHPDWGVLTVQVRPPFSKVWEFGSEDTRRLTNTPETPGTTPRMLSSDAQRLLAVVGKDPGLNLTELGQRVSITSKRRLRRLVAELEAAGVVRTRKLRERGQPRVIEVIQ